MLAILLTLLAWIPALVGLGSLAHHEGDPELRPGIAGLLGLGVLGAVATIANFFVPVSAAVATVLWAAGVGLFALRRRWLLEEARAADLIATLLVALIVVRLPWPRDFINYDTGLYHLQTVRWLREHPVQLGLAHVHDRLGFNSLFHAAAAGLEFLPAAGKSMWFANALPTVFAASVGFTGLRRLISGDGSFPTLFLAGTLVPATASLASFPGLGTDHAPALLAYVALALWARALAGRDWPGPDAVPATVLAAVALAMKVSTAVVLLGSLGILAVRWRKSASMVRLVALPALGIGLPWLARGVALSGCLVFPAAATCVVDRPWAVGTGAARNLTAWITSWARRPLRTPEEVLGNWEWLRTWPDVYGTDESRVLLLLFAGGLAMSLVHVRAVTREAAVPFVIALGGLAYWFATAPAPRFGYAYIYPLALMPLAFALSRVAPAHGRWGRVAAAAVVLLACSATFRSNCGGLEDSACSALLARGGWRHRRWIPYREWPPGPAAAATAPRVLRSGQVAFVPTADERCGDAPIPCTPWLDPNLLWLGGRFEIRRAALTAPPGAR